MENERHFRKKWEVLILCLRGVVVVVFVVGRTEKSRDSLPWVAQHNMS